MAEIIANDNSGKKAYKKKRAKRHSTQIDMTPMVDLMSLLITFFMLTAAFTKPKIMEILLPQENIEGEPGIDIPAPRTLNLLLSGNNSIFYYIGKPPVNDKEVETSAGRLQKTDYSRNGIRRTILKMNMPLYAKVDSETQKVITGKSEISQDSLLSLIKYFKKKDSKGPIVMIKADKNAKYKNIVDAIDEMAICNVARYAIVDISKYEQKLLDNVPH